MSERYQIQCMQVIYTQANGKVELADLGKRIVAFTLDILMLFALIGTIDYLTISSDEQAYFFKPERILHLLLGWLYFAGTETCACQGTVGKYLLGLRVTATTGDRISFKNASIRYFAKPVSVVLILFRFILGSYETPRRTFHDRLAHSLVISS